MYVDLSFRLTSNASISADHGYHLYSALSRVLPVFHQNNEIGIHPIRGRQIGNRQITLMPESNLVVRVPVNQIKEILNLSGEVIQIRKTDVLIGVPQITTIDPQQNLRSRLVVIKISGLDATQLSSETFRNAARKQLTSLGVSSQVQINPGKRRTLRIRDKEIVGYEVVLTNLDSEDSLKIQKHGLGGRRHMGCGLFMPFCCDRNE